MTNINNVLIEMINYYQGDPKRIQHFLKVHSFAKFIAEQENLPSDKLYILEIAGLMHDIGIKIAEQKYNSSNGKYQELEGPAPAREILEKLQVDTAVIDRVCFLIAHHHTYNNIDDLDYQILVEADFLVNLYEDNCPKQAIENALNRIFKTKTGINLCKTILTMKKGQCQRLLTDKIAIFIYNKGEDSRWILDYKSKNLGNNKKFLKKNWLLKYLFQDKQFLTGKQIKVVQILKV